MRALPRLILTRHLAETGASTRSLPAAVKSGALVRIRQGVYVEASAWAGLAAWQQYRLRIEAVADTSIVPPVFSHHSGASVWGIPTIQRGQPVHALTTFRGGGRSRNGVRRHLVEPENLDADTVDGLLVTSRVVTVLDLAATVPFAEALVPLDHVLKPDPARGLPALTKAGLLAALPGLYPAAVERRVRAAVEFADPQSGSAGESYSRGLIHVAGFESPTLQYEVRSSTGFVAFTDFYWKGSRTVGEFDGVEKYLKPEYLKGRTPGQVVVDEKLREDRIRATGRNVVRWDWADLWKPGEVEGKLATAGVARRRRSSAGNANSARTQNRSGDTRI
ncbi:hypothetical protein TV39_19440 [Arthrobacter sp. SPG23]|uniref:hypothetical protein n=1 Tax=Arthrobacter sp. SPG23 TaxID=1610703 RepID=UPI0005B84996|nr:hypothetical protein [Arthrobacter sp. SPG23]KIS25682.1 hypothetical protein TV39_19440 [Arthrobacter sp. SPG23]